MTDHLFCVRRNQPDQVVYVGSEARCLHEATQRGDGHTVEPFNSHRVRTLRAGLGLNQSLGMKETT